MERLHTLGYLAFLVFVLFVAAQVADAAGIASKGLPPEPVSTPEPMSKGLPPEPVSTLGPMSKGLPPEPISTPEPLSKGLPPEPKLRRRIVKCNGIPRIKPGVCSKRFKKADGKQHPEVATCSTVQLGQIPDADHMPAAIIISPPDQAVVPAKKDFEISVRVHNLATGFFSDPEIQYNAAAQQLNAEGVIMGHCHVTVQAVAKNAQVPPDPLKFAFFKGLNEVAKNGVLSVVVSDGLDSGYYRLCSLCASFTHQSTIMPVAKRGAQDDCIRFTVS